MSVQQDNKGRWNVAYRKDGKVKREYFGVGRDAKMAAKARDHEIKAAKAKGGFEVRVDKIYFDQLSQAYLQDCKARGVSEKTRKETLALFNKTVLALLTHKPVDQLDYTDITRLSEVWEAKSAATRNRYMERVRAVLRFGIKHELIEKNPMARWEPGREEQYDMRLDIDGLQKIMAHAAPHLRWAMEVEWNLGTRPGKSELLAIKWADVDIPGRRVLIRGSKTDTSHRWVNVTDAFAVKLAEKKLAAKSEYVIEYKGKPVNKLRRSFETARRKADLPYRVRMYDVRHLFATVLLTRGADLGAVASLLGHSSPVTTQAVYRHVMDGERQRAVNLLPELEEVVTMSAKVSLIK